MAPLLLLSNWAHEIAAKRQKLARGPQKSEKNGPKGFESWRPRILVSSFGRAESRKVELSSVFSFRNLQFPFLFFFALSTFQFPLFSSQFSVFSFQLLEEQRWSSAGVWNK